MNDYEPIRIKPLRLRGVYGITWMIYKRNFASMFLLALVLYGIALIVLGAANGGLMAGMTGFFEDLENGGFPGYDSFGMSANNPFQTIAGGISLGIGLWVLTMLLGLGLTLAVQPMIAGGLYTEASARLYGKYSGFKALLSRSKFMLRRFFTTNLCLLLAEWAISTVLGIVIGVLAFVMALSAMMSLSVSTTMSAGSIIAIVVVALLAIAIAVTAMSFLSFVYPVAVNEGLKNFKAVERSFKLVSKRFGRVLGVSLTLVLAAALVFGLSMTALLLLQITGDGLLEGIAIFVVYAAFICLFMPYCAALYTVLYFDVRVRLEGEGWLNYPETSSGDQAASAWSDAQDGQAVRQAVEEPQNESTTQQSDE
ncbi:MAG: hypothetical protein AAGU74_05745 [Bacillota bacterium]